MAPSIRNPKGQKINIIYYLVEVESLIPDNFYSHPSCVKNRLLMVGSMDWIIYRYWDTAKVVADIFLQKRRSTGS